MEAVGARAATRGGPGGTDSVGKGERRGRKVTRESLGEREPNGKVGPGPVEGPDE